MTFKQMQEAYDVRLPEDPDEVEERRLKKEAWDDRRIDDWEDARRGAL